MYCYFYYYYLTNIKYSYCPRKINMVIGHVMITWLLVNKSTNHYKLRNADFNIPRYNTVKYGKYSLRYYALICCQNLTKKIEIYLV